MPEGGGGGGGGGGGEAKTGGGLTCMKMLMCLFQQKRDELSQGRWGSRAGTNARFEWFSVSQVFQDIPQDILNEWSGLSGRRTCTMATIVMWTSRCKLDSLRDKLFSLKKSLYRIQTIHRTSYQDRPINISISETFIHRHFNQSPPHKKVQTLEHWINNPWESAQEK